ncbi:MAG TPA: hypothetical protein VNO20_00260 [Solirubrobacterales bacterium]|nr:hypothetical protein [Solirubrobacterales bacterium]
MRSARLRGTATFACIVGLLLALPALAGAAKYPPDPAARGFNGGAAGWQSSTGFDGNCLAPLLCPAATNSFQPAGGADGGGFIRSAYSGVVGVMAVAGTTTAVWQSPSFSYEGVAGDISYEGVAGDASPAVSFEMDRRASVGQLLAVAGNSADFSVRLVDVTGGGESVSLIAASTLAGADSWTAVRQGSIDPGQLVMGHEYRIQITTRYTTGTSVLVSGSADYDNVVLEAVPAGGDGSGGKGSGDGGLSEKRLGELVRAATPGTAILTGKGKRLLVRVRCPRKAGRTCRITAQGLLKKRKPVTNRRTVKVRKGKAKLVVLRVKPKARTKVAKRKRLLVRQKVRAGKTVAIVFKSRKLIRREVG